MSTARKICPSCGKSAGVPLVNRDKELLPDDKTEKLQQGEIVCGNNAIMIDDQTRPMNIRCVSCGAEWIT